MNSLLKTRPAPDAISWVLPLDAWNMPNAQDLDERETGSAAAHRSEKEGFVLTTRSLAIEQRVDAPPGAGFQVLAPPRPVSMATIFAPRIGYFDPVAGVTMELSDWNSTRDRSGALGAVGRRILEGRPDSQELTWPVQ